MRIVELFRSIQGESTHAGRICYFIRLAGCNLRCVYCDTLHAQSFDAGSEMTLDAVLDAVRADGTHLVEITGGEPLANKETPELARRLLVAGHEVLIETNGSLPIDVLPMGVCRILDCKLPASGMFARHNRDNYRHITPRDEIKFVVSDRPDFDCALQEIRQYRLADKTPNLLFSVNFSALPPVTLAEWVIASAAPIRMQLQMHKVLWGDRPGV